MCFFIFESLMRIFLGHHSHAVAPASADDNADDKKKNEQSNGEAGMYPKDANDEEATGTAEKVLKLSNQRKIYYLLFY